VREKDKRRERKRKVGREKEKRGMRKR